MPPAPLPPIFAVPSEEGARLALRGLFLHATASIDPLCAVAIDVVDRDGVLIQRTLVLPEAPAPVRDAFREAVDRNVTRFAESQRLDAMEPSPAAALRRAGGADPYRGGPALAASNEIAGFDCGHAFAVAKARLAKLNATLRSATDMDIRLYAVPFLWARFLRPSEREEAVILRSDDGSYVFEKLA